MVMTWIPVAVVTALASTGALQMSGASLAPDVARSFSALAENRNTGPKPDDRQVCLIRKSTGRTECRFKDEWREIARQIEKSEAKSKR